jgi:hypothetical protein
LIFAPVAALAWVAPASADVVTGLAVTGYSIDEIPPVRSDAEYPVCGQGTLDFINATWDSPEQQFGECGVDLFMLHYTGFIQIPDHQPIEFWVASDDGGTVKIGVHEFGVWQDQGCSATTTGQIQIEAGTRDLDAWFYENGGGTCFMLAWNIDDRGWEIIQPEFFTSEPLVAETTSILETTTTELVVTTSTIYQPSTTAAPETTAALPQTTSSSPPLPSSLPPEPSPSVVVEQPSLPVQTLPLVLEPTTSVQTTEPEPIETTPATSTTSSTTIPSDSTVSLPEPSETSTSVEVTPTTFFSPDEPLTSKQFAEVLTALSDATPEQISEILDTILDTEISSEQAEQLIASPEILSAITPEQSQQLFEQVEETQLSESMAAVIADALNDPSVPDEVKEVFEESINIFGNDGFATYVPTGSAVNVAVRRTIIAGTTILVALPSPVSTRRP